MSYSFPLKVDTISIREPCRRRHGSSMVFVKLKHPWKSSSPHRSKTWSSPNVWSTFSIFKLLKDLRYSFLSHRLHISLIRSRRCRCSNLGSWSVVLEFGWAQQRTVYLLRSTVRHWISSAISHFVWCRRISNCARCTWAPFRLQSTSTVVFPRKSMRWRRMFGCEIFNKSRSTSK